MPESISMWARARPERINAAEPSNDRRRFRLIALPSASSASRWLEADICEERSQAGGCDHFSHGEPFRAASPSVPLMNPAIRPWAAILFAAATCAVGCGGGGEGSDGPLTFAATPMQT